MKTHTLLPVTPQVEALQPDPAILDFLDLKFRHDLAARPHRMNNCGRPLISVIRDHPVTCMCEEGEEPRWDSAFAFRKHTSFVASTELRMDVIPLLRPSYLFSHP